MKNSIYPWVFSIVLFLAPYNLSARDSMRTSSRSFIYTETEKMAYYERLHAEKEKVVEVIRREASRTIPGDYSSYSIGEIPLQEGVGPSGARTYQIPIPTASGYKFVPSVSLAYSSQASEGWAGYGWDIQGISKITLISKNKYYHNQIKGANVFSADAVFALDGVPLITNTQQESSLAYPLMTATGHILVAPTYNNYGYVSKFAVLYPNGISATYGFNRDHNCQLPEYPVTLMTDLDNNRITFEYYYDSDYTNPRIHLIRYGYDLNDNYVAEVEFLYNYTSSYLSKYYAGKRIRHYNRLASVSSKNGNDTIGYYFLSYEHIDNEWLLTKVECHSGSESLRPIEFTYGQLVPPSPAITEGLCKSDSLSLSSAFSPTDDYVYRRGKFISRSYWDGLITHKSYSNYKGTPYLLGYKFGSDYPSDTKILLAPRLRSWGSVKDDIVTGSGFQTVEAVDCDGDGVDEIVRVNFNGIDGAYTRLLITVFKCDAQGNPVQDSQFEVTLNGVITSGPYKSPYRREYYWGDFLGNGKVQLLTVAYDKNYNDTHTFNQTSYITLIDIASQSKLCDYQLFQFPSDGPLRLLTCDLDNDSQTELCYATEQGLDEYRFNASTSTFVKEHTYSNITSSLLASSTNPHYITDLDGDGYIDIMIAPREETHSYWDRYAFTGADFISSVVNITARASGDVFMFMDINRDGLADLVKINGTSLGTYRNIDITSFGTYQQSPSSIANDKGIIPGSAVDPSASSGFLKVDGSKIYVYDYSVKVQDRRQLTKSTDSFGRTIINNYLYLPDHSKNWTDPGTTVDNSKGYAFRTLPLYVLQGDDAFLDETLSAQYRDISYSYHDGVIHNFGLGFCGFSKVLSFDYSQGFTVSTTATYDTQKHGVLASSVTYNSRAESRTSQVTNTYDDSTTTARKYCPLLTQSVALDSLTGITTTTSCTYGNYDLPSSVTTTRQIGTQPAQSETVNYTYQHSVNPSKYVLGAITQELHIVNADSNPDSTWRRRTNITYDDLFHPVTTKQYVGAHGIPVPVPHDPILQSAPGIIFGLRLVSTTRRTFDSRGNVTSEKTAPYGATEFVGDTLVYDANRRYLLSNTDALGHTTTYSNYNKFGKPTSVTDYQNRTTTYTYDSWGNLTQVSHPDGGVEQTTTAWGGDGLYTVSHTATGEPETITHYDALGREVKSGVKRFNGAWQWTNREYDGRGRLSRVSLPYRQTSSSGDPSYWNTYHYDLYDRPDTLLEASGKKTIWVYNGTSTTTVKDSVAITKTTDAMGRVVSVSDLGGTTTYTLRDDGQASSITAPGNVVTTFTYDDYGRQTRMVDPSLGTETDSYTWNADGSSQFTHTNRNGSVTTNRDKYGRVTYVSRESEFNTTYTYDTYGRLNSVSSTNSTGEQYTYDAYDRISTLKETVPDGKWLQKTYTYSTGSVLSSIAYTSQSGYITTETYTYANGHNTGITIPGAPGVGSTTVWGLVSENDLGQPTQIMSGWLQRQYGYTAFGLPTYRKIDDGFIQNFSFQFDPKTGNLLQRSGYLYNYTETFGYDGLNRMTEISKGNTSREIVYENNGNITSIDGVGTLIYGGGTGVSPYEVTGLTPEPGQPAYRQRAVTYNTFDRPETIAEGAYTSGLVYDADGDRVKMYVSDTLSGPFVIRYYIGGRYEYDLFSGTERLYLGGDAYSAPMVLIKSGAGGWTPYQIGRDYLGSITDISDLDGQSFQVHYRYDPWGRLVDNSTGQPYAPGSEPTLLLGRGYTGHEYLPWFGLINANARLYDPLLGRFLSPDPYVQDPDFSQNYNRYSYCLNNPLKYSDESGEFIGTMLTIGLISAYVFGFGNLAAHAIRGDDLGNWNWAKYFYSGALAGFVVGATTYAGLSGLAALVAKGGTLGVIGKVGLYGYAGLQGTAGLASMVGAVGGVIHNGWNGVSNAGKIMLGNFYLDENKGFFGQAGEGILRHTWEYAQQSLGYSWSQIRNCWADRVDYMAGAAFVTDEYAGFQQGVTLGNYCNIDLWSEIGPEPFDDYVLHTPLFMHEWGHTVDSKRFGVSYLFAIGIPSVISAANDQPISGKDATTHDFKSYEMRANRNAAKYFNKHYKVDWSVYESKYPRKKY
ncbi:MAG: hypothetical protein IJM05_04465 [Bacteroidales bacterium]|nr:hypothetical protein [Bacteroidales bacterium]